MQRVNLGKAAPELYKSVAELDRFTNSLLKNSNIEEGFAHLLRLRASQINRCAFCIRLHTQDALKVGESIDRITLLNAWEETQYFSEKERCALKLVEEMTLISGNQVSETTYNAAMGKLTEQEIVAIEWLAITINTWNRIAIASRYVVQP